MLNKLMIKRMIEEALIEDMNYGDITTDSLLDESIMGEAIITAKETGVIAGLPVAEATFKILDEKIEFIAIVSDGNNVSKGDDIAIIKGSLKNIIKAERTALNLLQRMSGIATKAHKYAEIVKDYPVRIVDTRKTTPGLRSLEKYAVKVGGCSNHRYNLSDEVMIKDNHIKAVGGISEALEKCRKAIPHTTKIEIEVETLEQLKEAIAGGADIVLLDNMDTNTMKEAVEINQRRVILEASGNITEERLKEIAAIGIDVISVGALTHTVKAMDISLNLK
ncbi:carboxylating nicotinate-nucleotide diphosphorylase [Alkaliphilus hydrothermalis]|uniref:nicotinate-nucleotide diphosphorylase (carboxylating) n=1 Tax=Alkaliphilus hydrothermalis TaxID=1482730 RepID=A0ABS2NP89_9FIRM|nr:carboxylating nicotinate-nucleotide diphosphorylase [Alkaliphilus hydrothermalis]MBM7614676.1 nicotinate-nucleotide pyrophosphorylase (carboxylating) [Alkaliphilus hydrothermalis]